MLTREKLKSKRIKILKSLTKDQLLKEYIRLYDISLQKTELLLVIEGLKR